MGKNTAEPDRRRRVEEARRKQRKAEQRRTFLAVGGAGVAAAVLITGALFWDTGKKTKAEPTPSATALLSLGVAKDAASCGEVETEKTIPKGSQHKAGNLTWPVTPPDGGEHRAITLRNVKNFYSRADKPVPEEAVHDLEHGLVVIWYDNKATDAEIEVLRQVAASVPDKRTLVVPWLRDDFSGDRHVVLTSWGHRQRCGKVSGVVVNDFVTKYKDGKDAPEKGLPV